MEWLDRISGERRQAPEMPFAPGQWRYCGQRPLTVRDAEARPGDVLMPDPSGRCNVSSLGPIRCDAHYVPDDDALRSVRIVGHGLRALEGRPWSAWIAETPLIPTLDEALDETPIEREIAMKLGYLEIACQRPRTDLQIDEERLLVGRCKRTSARAPAVLAARSDDWEARTLWGVRPRRVLGIVRDELYDIYPNRVAVALVDKLDAILRRRLRSVHRVVELLKQRKDYQNLLENSHNYQRATRILELWGDAVEGDGPLNHAKAVQDRILKLRRRVLALKGTRLYREIGRRQGRLELKMTNVLSNDDVYRHIAELWQSWEDHIRSLSVDPDVCWRQNQDAAAGFERFAFLVIVRALNCLGYSAKDMGQPEELPDETTIWKLDGPAGEVILRRDRSCISVCSVHAGTPLRFVSLPAMLEAGGNVGRWIATVREQSVVVVALPADEPRAPAEARVRLHSLSDSSRRDPMFVAIAPWDLESVERVARVVRIYVWSALYARYPVTIRPPEGWAAPAHMPRWMGIAGGAFNVISPPAVHERPWVALNSQFGKAAARLADAEKKLDACDPRDKRKRLRLKHELDCAARDHDADRQVCTAIEVALAHIELLLVCPVCRTASDTHSFEHTSDLFRSQCSECGSTWGRRTCRACDELFPFLDFPQNKPSEEVLGAERRYGADVLAIPVTDNVYVCTSCASRTDGGPSSCGIPSRESFRPSVGREFAASVHEEQRP